MQVACLLSHNDDTFVISSLGIFASADAAYVLAYSVIMLTTDLHSDQVGTAEHVIVYSRFNQWGDSDIKQLHIHV